MKVLVFMLFALAMVFACTKNLPVIDVQENKPVMQEVVPSQDVVQPVEVVPVVQDIAKVNEATPQPTLEEVLDRNSGMSIPQ